MHHKLLPLLVIDLFGSIVLILSSQAIAVTPLTRAEIQNLYNLVQLLPKNSSQKRPARKLDSMIPGDGLSTGRASRADLRFNDGSLALVGEEAIFQFLPKTRNFRLSNGTVLLLIQPGKGQTRIQTPSAAAAIRGSALFVRYDQQTDTTIVGALTNSGIEVSNKEASQTQVLQAGQLIVIVKGQFQGLYDFDLKNFYETSELVRELNLTKKNVTTTPDPAIASVQAEIVAALKAQSPITGQGVIENPSFLQLTGSPSNPSNNASITENSPQSPITQDSSVNSFVESGQVLSNTTGKNNQNHNNNNLNSGSTQVGNIQKVTETPRATPTPRPTLQPTPTPQPTIQPTPTPQPTIQPTPEPQPTIQPTPEPQPTIQPTPEPQPTIQPTPEPQPTIQPTPEPQPTIQPTPEPQPTIQPTPEPTLTPTPTPSGSPDRPRTSN